MIRVPQFAANRARALSTDAHVTEDALRVGPPWNFTRGRASKSSAPTVGPRAHEQGDWATVLSLIGSCCPSRSASAFGFGVVAGIADVARPASPGASAFASATTVAERHRRDLTMTGDSSQRPIVIFDRIRENLPHAARLANHVINVSINQNVRADRSSRRHALLTAAGGNVLLRRRVLHGFAFTNVSASSPSYSGIFHRGCDHQLLARQRARPRAGPRTSGGRRHARTGGKQPTRRSKPAAEARAS